MKDFRGSLKSNKSERQNSTKLIETNHQVLDTEKSLLRDDSSYALSPKFISENERGLEKGSLHSFTANAKELSIKYDSRQSNRNKLKTANLQYDSFGEDCRDVINPTDLREDESP
jgi:hypothetical protein